MSAPAESTAAESTAAAAPGGLPLAAPEPAGPGIGGPNAAFQVYDTTLRDGSQREGISYSVEDKLAVARLLDELGVGFIEGGWPGATPKDTEFFRRAQTDLKLETAELVAFGSTRRAGVAAQADEQVAALLAAQTPAVCLVAKSDRRHVERALRTTPEENLAMITDTVAYLVAEGRRVFLDCEHFFDGYRFDAEHGLRVVAAGIEAGADVAVLCDTNGGMLPHQVGEIVREVGERTGARLGIHCQDDTSCAVANSLAAIAAGAVHFQGTANGYGERCGNADLFAVVAALELKLDRPVLPEGRLTELVRVSHAIAEIANIAPNSHQAYVGMSAFAHKAGLHASAIKVDPDLYQHLDPAAVGNDMRMLVSELAGRATVELKGRELGLDLSADRAATGRVADRVKELESAGWVFEAAEASFELLLRAELGESPAYYALESWRVIVEQRADGAVVSEATVKLSAAGERVVATGEGNGPVNALDTALRLALAQTYPGLADLELLDYKVRIVEGSAGTGAVTRVLVTTGDGHTSWATTGVDENIIAASWHALDEAITYGLLRQGATPA